ncbi:MAG: ATP-binding cassette domain-containing protein [Euryarchaeota archaeon]|nr:ATP-binding cassette domain-containing protein [Euryarchaeota archaeon]
MRALDLRNVRFRYRGSDAPALDNVSLEVEKGEFVTILGANGSGKSTVCMLANGLIPHSIQGDLEGIVRIFGFDVKEHEVAEFTTKVGMVFQEPESQLFCMSVEEEVAFGPENLAVPRDEIRERVEWALELVGMKGYNDRSPFSLSGGQKQRVAIAAALSMRPEMLVLDEPAYALDPIGRIELYSVLKDLKEKYGMTVLLAERDAEEAAAFSDRLVLMKGGRVVESGPPRLMLRDPEDLRSIGVTPPQVAEVARLLNARMMSSKFSFLNVDEAEKTIVGEILASKAGGGK